MHVYTNRWGTGIGWRPLTEGTMNGVGGNKWRIVRRSVTCDDAFAHPVDVCVCVYETEKMRESGTAGTDVDITS